MDISLTDFIDFVTKVGTTKYTKVKELKGRKEYNVAFDFWKLLRDRIIETHRNGRDIKKLDALMSDITDNKKIKLYPNLIEQYKAFIGRKKLEWFNPPSTIWKKDELKVKINPELGLKLNEKPYVIKLYFKSEPLAKMKIEIILLLLNEEMKKDKYKNVNFGILDVSHKKLFDSSKLNKDYLALLEGEAMNFINIWNNL